MFFDLTASKGVHVALVKMDSSKYNINSGEKGDVTCVRVCLIKWDHIDWIDSILKVFESTLEEVKS